MKPDSWLKRVVRWLKYDGPAPGRPNPLSVLRPASPPLRTDAVQPRPLSGTGYLSALPVKQVSLVVTPAQGVNLLAGINQLLGAWQGQNVAMTKFVENANVAELTTFRNDLAGLLKSRGLS